MFISPGASSPPSKAYAQLGRTDQPERPAPTSPQEVGADCFTLTPSQQASSSLANPFALQSGSNPEVGAQREAHAPNKRPSRHARYQDVLTSPETDDEIESSDKVSQKKAKRRVLNRRSLEKKAKELGVGNAAADYKRYQSAKKARELGVGETAADYQRYQKAKKARELGVGETAADYQRYRRAKRARELGVGETAVDYERYQKAKRAQALGVGETAADYKRYQNEKRAQALGVGETAADYDRYRKAEKARELGVGETAADYQRYRRAKRLDKLVAEQLLRLKDGI